MSRRAEQYKEYYDAGFWTKEALKNVAEKGKITMSEYMEIIEEE